MGRRSLDIILVVVALLLAAVPSAHPRPHEGGRQAFPPLHAVNQSRTWSIWVTLETCGDVIIDRIDEFTLDGPPEQPLVVSRNQLKILQWTVDDVTDRDLSLGGVLSEMSLRRYVFRVWVRASGRVSIVYLYFSPYGASDEKMPPLPPDGAHDPTTRLQWMSMHRWTARSPWNPKRNAFDHFFPHLLRHGNAKMEMTIGLDGPGCQRELVVLNERSRNMNIRQE